MEYVILVSGKNDMCRVSWSIPYKGSAAKHVSTRDPGNEHLVIVFLKADVAAICINHETISTLDEVILSS